MRKTLSRATPLVLALALVTAAPAAAQPLRIVNVGAPAVNCVFAPSCTVTVTDFADSVFGAGFLQSRTYRAQPGSPAEGLWVYEYRIDLRAAGPGMVNEMAIDFGPVVSMLDYDGNGRPGDQVFVVVSGGLGSVGPFSAIQTGRVIHFRFNPSVHGAGAAAAGQSTYFFGLVSAAPPREMRARLLTGGGTIAVDARAPERRALPRPLPPGQVRPRPSGAIAAEDCLPYDPRRLGIADEGAQGWLLTDGASRMLMLDNQADAQRALALARRHTAHCFIGRGNARPNRAEYITHYWTGSSGMTTSIPGEDCVSYNPLTVGIFDRGALGWRMEDGAHLMLLFDNRADAERGLAVARAAGGRLCMIGRDNARPDRASYIVEYWP